MARLGGTKPTAVQQWPLTFLQQHLADSSGLQITRNYWELLRKSYQMHFHPSLLTMISDFSEHITHWMIQVQSSVLWKCYRPSLI